MTQRPIIDENISDQMRNAYLDYAMSVITSRALPDVRDGLKPVQRRILYAMHSMGAGSSTKTRKSAAVVGEVLGKYHPHGNVSVYEAMVKLAQVFGTRYPLVIGQGNFGSIDGDPPAAERYTEAKLSTLAEESLSDIDKKTVQWRPNYENTLNEPVVFPGMLPNLLLNGTKGIAVGVATDIPPHNLKEVCSAIEEVLENKDATNMDLLKHIKGPDFPGGAIAYDKKAIEEAYSTGKGGVLVRGEVEVVEDGKLTSIIITSLPYRVNKSELITKIAALVTDKKIDGVKDVRDESTNDIRIVIDLKSAAKAKQIVNTLYKHTSIEATFHYNMVALVNGAPQLLSLRDIISEYILHRQKIVRMRTEFELSKAKDREHILVGLKDALDHIDAIITLIRKAEDVPSAHAQLCKKFKFSEAQATAILEMRLQKLAGLERKKILDELKQLEALINTLETILKTEKNVNKEIKKELEKLINSYGDDRRTDIVNQGVSSVSNEDLIPDESTVVVLTEGGYIKRTNPEEYRVQKRGGVGSLDLNTKDEDGIEQLLSVSQKDTILFFTNKGKVFKLKAYELPEGKRATRGKALVNFLSLGEDEKVNTMVPMNSFDDEIYITLVTKNGIVKRMKGSSFKNIRVTGIIAITLEDDSLEGALLTQPGDSVLLATRNGKSIRFDVKDVRPSGRTARGVRGILLSKDDEVIGLFSIKAKEKALVFVVSEKGYGKMTESDAYKIQKRGGTGIKTMEVSESTGGVVAAYGVTDPGNTQIVAISKKGQTIRITLADVPTLGRQTKGVRIMRLRAGDSVASITCLG